MTTDPLVEGVHFAASTPAGAVGHKAAAVNLSDLGAMGAEPAWMTLALTLPGEDPAWLEAFSEGLYALADRYDVALVGGDLTRGPLTITVQVMGWVPAGSAILRTGARPGDRIFVTGTIGDAGLGLAFRQGELTGEGADREHCCQRLDRPLPRVEVGLALRGLASAAIDVSDGLAIDLGRILSASGVGAQVDLARLPLSPAAHRAMTGGADWQRILAAGDDYELVFTVAEADVSALHRRLTALEVTVAEVGHIEAAPGLSWLGANGEAVALDATGYHHF